ncbi:type II secretion system protein [Sulfitobacter sp. D35]|uniref:type II secretion system protein n=1 Tax=Sulfitobacter sp. D35 TaxID=3083252 RepID=UPI00296FC91E|nr:type II secretion system protein [Sulfitobacter sp. D35]MDW4500486.1 type II secretion system protein [Sulfitobacter sp. D35]
MRITVKPFGDDGLSLVEVLIAILVLSIATVGLFRVFGEAATTSAANQDRVLAGMVARNHAVALQLGDTGLPDRVRFAGRDWQLRTEVAQTSGGFEEVTIDARPVNGGGGSVLTTYRAARSLR